MSSNLPPGVSESSIPGNRPQDEAFERWLDGKIGDLLYQLAELSLPDVTDHRFPGRTVDLCNRCYKTIPRDQREESTCPWPPYDIEQEVIDRLQRIKEDLDRA